MRRPRLSPPLKRSLATSCIVGTGVSVGHALAAGASWWPLVHTLLPAAAFASGAWGAGHRALNARLVVRGAATIALVSLTFTTVNGRSGLLPWVRVALNYLVPLLVSIVGATAADSPHAPPR